jgi:hypothetical protein
LTVHQFYSPVRPQMLQAERKTCVTGFDEQLQRQQKNRGGEGYAPC